MRPKAKQRPPRRFHGYLLVLPVVVSLGLLAADLADNYLERAAFPFWWNGRNGLTFWQTLWDTDVFWGTLWFNIMLILLISAFLVFRFHPGNDGAFRLSRQQERKILVVSGGITAILLIAMGITWDPWFKIANNWFSTQFAYRLPAWPAIVAFLAMIFLSINSNTQSRKSNLLGWTLLGGFLVVWLFLVGITNFHPHAIYGFKMQLHVLLTTIAFPGCLIAFTVEKLKAKQETRSSESKRALFITVPLLIFSLGIIALLQFIASFTVPLEGEQMMFDLEIEQYYALAHWPSWLFVGSTSIFVLFASRSIYRWWHEKGRGSWHPARLARRLPSVKAGVLASLVLCSGALIPALVAIQHDRNRMNQPLLLVNQVGYYNNAPKRILYQSVKPTSDLPEMANFTIHDATTGSIVHEGSLMKNVTRYGHSYMVGNFTGINTTGEYRARATVNGHVVKSTTFRIGSNVYDDAIEMAMRFFYYQRDNYKVKDLVDGYPGHAAGHMDDALVFNGSNEDDWIYKNLTGAWYDAGDYNKHINWFQTSWYCMQALAECALLDPAGKFSALPDLTDSNLPDVSDEALWGALYLVNLVNEEGIRGPQFQYLVFETVRGFRNQAGRTASMSYWGPPERDWTTPRRCWFNNQDWCVPIDGFNSTFLDWYRGYDIAASIMHAARLIDESLSIHPGTEFPAWVINDTTHLRNLAANVHARYQSMQGGYPDDVQSFIGKLYYAEEESLFHGNWSSFDALIDDLLNTGISPSLSSIPDAETYHLHFGWNGYYLLGNILTHYLTYNRTIPAAILSKVQDIQDNHFSLLFDEPFRIKHGRLTINGTPQNILFHGAERQTDILTSAWLQSLMVRVNPAGGKPFIVQSMLDWIFGVNPAGVCMMEGVGTVNFPQYHHRLGYARNPRGAVPGALPNGMAQVRPTKEEAERHGIDYNDLAFLEEFGDIGMIASWPGNPLMKDGVPSNPNEVWIPHNAMLLRLLASIEMDNFLA
ncbi:hypothetical protein GF325_09015 [Candidatus Bathyarchaeota archaeon]|nr:hypothetical protein [Candidatus Bathyarchaeota archaeon]